MNFKNKVLIPNELANKEGKLSSEIKNSLEKAYKFDRNISLMFVSY